MLAATCRSACRAVDQLAPQRHVVTHLTRVQDSHMVESQEGFHKRVVDRLRLSCTEIRSAQGVRSQPHESQKVQLQVLFILASKYFLDS